MKKETYEMQRSWGEVFSGLNIYQAGILIKMIAAYQDGLDWECEDQEILDIFMGFKEQFDRDREAYETKCKKMKENGKKGGRPQKKPKAKNEKKPKAKNSHTMPSMTTQTPEISQQKPIGKAQTKRFNKRKEKEKCTKEKDKEILYYTPLYPPNEGESDRGVSELLTLDVSSSVRAAVSDWFDFKAERGDRLRSISIKKLKNQIMDYVRLYGDTAVISVIDQSIASGYRGIAWGILRPRRSSSSADFGAFMRRDYDFGAIERELVVGGY